MFVASRLPQRLNCGGIIIDGAYVGPEVMPARQMLGYAVTEVADAPTFNAWAEANAAQPMVKENWIVWADTEDALVGKLAAGPRPSVGHAYGAR